VVKKTKNRQTKETKNVPTTKLPKTLVVLLSSPSPPPPPVGLLLHMCVRAATKKKR